MSAGSWFTKRRAFYTVAIVVAISLVIVAIRDRSWYQATMPAFARLGSYVASRIPASSIVNWTSKVSSAASARGDFAEIPGSSVQLAAMQGSDLSALSPVRLESMYFAVVEQLQIRCPSSERVGSALDGGWDVCFADPFDIRKSRPCVAFSFGINDIWGYDDLLADRYHCAVHMFDPSMKGVTDHQRRNSSWFYLTGLSSENKLAPNGWKMRTLCRLFSDLGYADKPVDILKVDIEFWEWDSFEQAVRDGCLRTVKQLLFETHTAEMLDKASDYARYIRVWRDLFRLGFRTWKWHKNPDSTFFTSKGGAQRACCYEHYMINTNFL